MRVKFGGWVSNRLCKEYWIWQLQRQITKPPNFPATQYLAKKINNLAPYVKTRVKSLPQDLSKDSIKSVFFYSSDKWCTHIHTMFAKVVEPCSLDVHAVNICQHTAHGRVDLPSLGRLHTRKGGVFEDTPIHVSHQIERSPYHARERRVSLCKNEKKTWLPENTPTYLSSSQSEKRCGTGIPASPAAFFTLHNDTKLAHMTTMLRSHDYN